MRRGGFGGAAGLADYLLRERIDALIDATHPYATYISANAAAAAREAAVPLVALRRPPWIAQRGDRWIEVADAAAAVRALGRNPRRVFVALGRNELRALRRGAAASLSHPQRRSGRSAAAVAARTYVTGRGPFAEADDRALMTQHGIDVVIAKNSGGTATYGKIAAARALGVSVIMLRRPRRADAPAVESVDDAIAWLDHALTSAAARGV